MAYLRYFKYVAALLLIAILCVGLLVPVSALEINTQLLRNTAQQKYGTKGLGNVDKWLAVLEQAADQTPQQQLNTINQFWNRVALGGEDKHIWGVEDYWATPLETLGKAAADCEDYVIGKYFSLVRLGVPAEKLRFIYVRAQFAGSSIAHMVLGYYDSPNAVPLILDNLTSLIRPANQRPDLTPVFSFNAQGVYVSGAAPSSVDRISRWRGLLDKMRKEGLQP